MKYDIYLASGWFNNNQKAKMELVLHTLRSKGFSVFAPFELELNVRIKEPFDRESCYEIYKNDIQGINNSKMVFAIYDECDSGTMMEIGYSVGIQKDVVVLNTENFMNLMISVPCKGVYHDVASFLTAMEKSNTIEDIITNSEEWKKENF